MTERQLGWAGRVLRLAAVVGIASGFSGALAAVSAMPHAGANEPSDTPFVRVRIDQVTPDVVTNTSPPVVTVTGMVSNVGDRAVRDVMVRLEHAAAVSSSTGLRTSLDGSTDEYQAADDFITVSPELQRGQEAAFTLTAPLRSLAGQSLTVNQPGIFPVLVNVNGTPDYGAPARLDNAKFLLPVIGIPADHAADLNSDVAPDTSTPVAVTMLWPLADRPRLAPGAPGGTLPVRLTDDDLATSLAPGGRLDILLAAIEVATGHDADPDGAVGRSLCLAIDPDLLVTVNAMTGGYVVSDAPDGLAQQPGKPTHPGTGQSAATTWLTRLRTLAQRTCVAALPYAQADLDALKKVDNGGLSAAAVNAAPEVVDHILGVASIRGVTLLPDGPLTSRAVDLLGANGNTVAIAAAELSDPDTHPPTVADTAPKKLSAQVVTAPFDPAVGAALAAAGTNPIVPTYLGPALAIRLTHDSVTARRQDALGSLLWRGLQRDAAPRTQILMPPGTWNLQTEDAQALLSGLATTIHSGLAVPRPLPAVIFEAASRPQPPGPTGSYTAAHGQFTDEVTTEIAGQAARLGKLTSALTTDERTGLTGVQYTAPLREDMLRALSQSERPDTRNGMAQQRLAVVGGTINDLFGAVTIVNPGGSYTLATEHSPLPLALHNALSVPIRVKLQVDTPPGMTVTDVGVIELPPGYLPLRVPIEVKFTQRVAIDVALRTPDGVPLGEPVRLSVHSNAYGKVLFAITMTAGAVLVLLAGRRLWHRFRGEPDRADLDRPDPPYRHDDAHDGAHFDAHDDAPDDRAAETKDQVSEEHSV